MSGPYPGGAEGFGQQSGKALALVREPISANNAFVVSEQPEVASTWTVADQERSFNGARHADR